MLEVLQFILSTPINFIGTVALILVIGIAGSAVLSPFGRPRVLNVNENFYEEMEDEDEDN